MFNGQCSAVGVRLENTFIISFDRMYAEFAEAIDEMGTCTYQCCDLPSARARSSLAQLTPAILYVPAQKPNFFYPIHSPSKKMLLVRLRNFLEFPLIFIIVAMLI